MTSVLFLDSIVSSSSSAEKRFLTPSGILLYREQQVDSMLDTKRVHRSSSSSERPMSPLAVRKSNESLNDNSMNNKVYKDDHEGYKKDNARDEDDTDSDSETDDDDVISVRGKNNCIDDRFTWMITIVCDGIDVN